MPEPIVAGEHHVIGRDGAADLRRGAFDEIDAVFGRQMLQDEAQLRKLLDPFREMPVDERLLPVEDIDVRIGILAVHQERHVDLFHALQARA